MVSLSDCEGGNCAVTGSWFEGLGVMGYNFSAHGLSATHDARKLLLTSRAHDSYHPQKYDETGAVAT